MSSISAFNTIDAEKYTTDCDGRWSKKGKEAKIDHNLVVEAIIGECISPYLFLLPSLGQGFSL